jgi:hypothetical protein
MTTEQYCNNNKVQSSENCHGLLHIGNHVSGFRVMFGLKVSGKSLFLFVPDGIIKVNARVGRFT